MTQIVTEKQRAYHLRKMRTRMARVDINHDGFLSREDYELMGIKLTECGEMTEKQAEATRREFLRVADEIGLKPGLKIPLQQAAKNVSDSLLAMNPEQQKASLVASGMMYDLIDTNDDGYISIPEFKAFFKVLSPDIPEAKVVDCFNTLDTNKNQQISRDEFLAAAHEFMHGLEESPISTAFYGDLVD